MSIACVFNFILIVWPKTNLIARLKQHYGQRTVYLFRKLEKTYLKTKKIDLDIAFMRNCQKERLIPTFCKLKPATRQTLSSRDLCNLQRNVLSLELKNKFRIRGQLNRSFHHLLQDLRSRVGFFTYISIRKFLRSSGITYLERITVRHTRKLCNLRRHQRADVNVLDSDKVVVNLSSQHLTDAETVLLSKGLAFSIPSRQLDRSDVMTSFEMLFRSCTPGLLGSLHRLKQRLRHLCMSYIYGYNHKKFTNLSEEEQSAFRSLLHNKDIVICRPDKGNGVDFFV